MTFSSPSLSELSGLCSGNQRSVCCCGSLEYCQPKTVSPGWGQPLGCARATWLGVRSSALYLPHVQWAMAA